MNWQVYIVLCTDDSLYTGITTDAVRRFAQHLAGTGARYFRGHTPLRVVYLEAGHDRSSASRREAEIKRLRPHDKRLLIASAANRIKLKGDTP
jgi:putative endonuclease